MKIQLHKIGLFLISSFLFINMTGCSDWMNTEPEGNTMTTQQLQDAAKAQESAALGQVNAMYSQMITLYCGLGDLGEDWHSDFGYASVCLYTENGGQDMVSPSIGFNWFDLCKYPDCRDNSSSTNNGMSGLLVWNTYYKIINAANKVFAMVSDTAQAGSMATKLGQAQAVRAFCYMQLAQLYQQSYDIAKDKKCVPIVTENMSAERQAANPRATVQEVYDFVERDLNGAIKNLEGYNRSDKSAVNQAVAYGLRARMNLLKQNYSQAEADARQCLELSGATSLDYDECNVPGFANASAQNVIWANIVTENNEITQTGIINWSSHLCSLNMDGYCVVGAYRSILSTLYDEIPANDVRKGWWLDKNLESPLLDVESYADAAANLQSSTSNVYVNVKFGTKNNLTSGLAACAADWILMRAEEMELIIAECKIQYEQDGGAYLANWVNKNRMKAQKGYTISGSAMDALWLQRRIELWGEGFSFQDLMRLHKGITRVGTNWPAVWQQDIPANHGCLLWRIPETEIQSNGGISDADNNPFISI